LKCLQFGWLLPALLTLSAAGVCGALAQEDEAAPTRQVVPRGADLERMQQLVDEAYRPKEATTPKDKAELAGRINNDLHTATDAVSRYVLLETIRLLAGEAGQLDLAMFALVELERAFDVDHAGPRLKTLSQLTQSVDHPLDRKDLCH